MAIIARYGVGIYGTSRYGEADITASIAGVSATGAIAPIVAGGFEVDISERLGSVAATGTAGTVQVNVAEVLAGVSATGSIGTPQPIVSFSVDVVGVSAVASLGTVEAKTTEVVNIGVSATGAVGSLTLHTTAGIAGVQGTFTVGAGTYTGVQFDFNAVRELYDRRRTSVIDRAA